MFYIIIVSKKLKSSESVLNKLNYGRGSCTKEEKIIRGNGTLLIIIGKSFFFFLPEFAYRLCTLQMFTGIYGWFIGKSECGDFKFMGIACYPQSL